MTRRHPLRALFGGLLLGLGLSLVLIMLGMPLLGEWTVIGLTLGIAVLGIVVAYAWPPRSAPRI